MTNGAVIARCSQPEVGWFGWRSQEDENLLHAIGTACAMDSSSFKKQLLKEMGHKNYHKNGHTDAIPNGDVIHDGSDNDDDNKEALPESGVVEQRKVLVVDARSYSAAVVNRAKGGGCECEGKLVYLSFNTSGCNKPIFGLNAFQASSNNNLLGRKSFSLAPESSSLPVLL